MRIVFDDASVAADVGSGCVEFTVFMFLMIL